VSITDSTSIGDLDTPVHEDLRYAPSAALWRRATEHFPTLGQPDKFFDDRSQSEWLSYTITTDNHDLLDQIARITTQAPGNALNTWIDSDALLSIVVHHQPHYHAQKPNESVLLGCCLCPRREGDFVKKPFIEMTGKEMLEETPGHLAAVDTATDNIADHTQEIMASIVNVVAVHMPYASALFNCGAVGDRPLVVPKRSRNLAFVSQFAEMPFDMVFTEQCSVRCAQIAVYHFLGIPESRFTQLRHDEKSPGVLARAAVTMFR
jgi:oleate hydratase